MDDPNPYRSPESIDKPLDHQPFSTRDDLHQYASRWLRLAGATIDSAIGGVISAVVDYSLGFHDMLRDLDMSTQEQLVYLSLLGMAVFGVINVGPIYTRGQTIGKMICGTVVVTRDHRRVSGNRYIFLREVPIWIILLVLPVLGPIFVIIDALAIL